MNHTDHRLWGAWRLRRDERAFEQLVRPHARFAVDLARRLGCSPADADDVCQQALVDLAAARTDKPVDVGVRAWLCRRVSLGVRTLVRDRARRHRHESSVPVRAPAPPPLDVRDEVEAALDALDERAREVLVLRFLHDMEYAEVAYVLGVTKLAVRLRVHRALATLRHRLGRAAPAVLAALALMRGARPAHALAPAAVAITTKSSLLVAAVVLAALFVFQMRTVVRAEEPRAGRVLAQQQQQDPGQPAAAPQKNDAPNAGVKPKLVKISEADLRDYAHGRILGDAWRQTMDLRAQVDSLRAQVGRLDKEKEQTAPDPITRKYLADLLAAPDRLGTFLDVHERYLKQTGDVAFLPDIARIARTAPDSEDRALVVASLAHDPHPRVKELLVNLLGVDDEVVRAALMYTVPVEHVRAGIKDLSARVRWRAAQALEFYVREPVDADVLLDGLAQELHPLAQDARIRAAAHHGASDEQIEKALAGAKRHLIMAPKPGPTRDPEQKNPDPLTRDYLTRLWAHYTASQDKRTLDNLTASYRSYLDRTGDKSLLPTMLEGEDLATLAKSLIGVDDPALVDQLLAWRDNDDADVRAAALRALFFVKGSERDRAHAGVLDLVDDENKSVRTQAALYAGMMKGNIDAEGRVLAVLMEETELTPALAMAKAVMVLDPEGGRLKLETIAKAAAEPSRALIERVLRLIK